MHNRSNHNDYKLYVLMLLFLFEIISQYNSTVTLGTQYRNQENNTQNNFRMISKMTKMSNLIYACDHALTE